MPMYGFICPRCGATTEEFGPIKIGPPSDVECTRCAEHGTDPFNTGTPGTTFTYMVRDYKTDAPFIAPVPQQYYSPSLGRLVSDQKHVTEAMKQITEDSVARTGYEPKLQAMHHSEIQPAAESHRDPTGQALENAMKAAHDGAGKPNKGAAA